MTKLTTVILLLIAIQAWGQTTKLAEVEIIKEWNVKKDIQAIPGTTYEYILEDDTARYLRAPAGKKIRAKITFFDANEPTTPPPPPATIYTDTIDDRDVKIKYSSGWQPFNGNVYYKKTAQYNPSAGSSFSFTFTGFHIQWWAERRFNHGAVKIEIFNSQTQRIRLIENITQYNARTNNVRELIWQDSLAQGQYTMVVTMTVKDNVTDYIVIKSLTPIVGSVDPIPDPLPPLPAEDRVPVYPEQDVKRAIETASTGKTIEIQPGVYTLIPIYVPIGVNILCKNEATIFAASAGTEGSGVKAGIFNLSSGSKVNGNQYIKGCTLDGSNTGYSAIMINNRDNITIEGHTIKDFNFNGVWISNSTGSKVLNNIFTNTAWSDTRYLSGALNIAGVTDMLIQYNKFLSNKNSKGTGIEALWKNTPLTNVKILNNIFDLSHHNPWNNSSSKNFSIELHDTYYRGLEIAYNEFQNEMSLASHKPGDGSKTWIHHNTGNLEGDTYFIETVADDFNVHDNVVSNAQMFAANFQKNSVWKNWVFRNNRLEKPAPMPSWGGAVLIGPLGVQNVLLEANALPSPTVKYMGTTGGVTIR